ncbi:aldo/keto reductase [Fructobacillus americanaquae]|uniref:Aldo/keto reductase n=1 Tax=Fructobacillus americanaquae TaxID=2940302 RepID=A0ABY5C059_9LACO|nr:aldo/keto reductase [Fructobacillus americanaquae]USS91568.1 aldo/keto reductase [Fructobacillus americanaquae]
MLEETYQLSNQVKIPKIAFGTWLLDNQEVVGAVENAIKVGYRHIDTASAYGNEEGVGQGIRNAGIKRSEVFVTTKLAAEVKDYKTAKAEIDNALSRLKVDYIDLLLIHSPKPWADYKGTDHYFEGNLATWQAMEEAYAEGKVKAIGVANFEQVDLQNLIKNGHIKPMVNQVLAHIGHMPLELINYAQQHDILVEAHSPFGHGDLMNNVEIKQLASKLNVTVPQLAVRYLLELGLLPLPKASTVEHMKMNAATNFVIPTEMMQKLTEFSGLKYSDSTSVFPVYQ